MPWRLLYNASVDSQSVIFKTHLNYVKCMVRLTNGLVINIHVAPTAPLDPDKIVKFESLSRITKISIDGEKSSCDREREFAQVAAPWIPVKCYYYLYYLESILLYLLNSSETGFSHGGHTNVKGAILTLLKNGTLSLSGTDAASLATVVTWGTADSFRTTMGSTISANYHSTAACDNSLRGKIAEYIEIDWKYKKRILNYRTLIARTKKATELVPSELCLLDYFYWMRIKSNYRDVDFLDFDNNVNENDAYEYLTKYIKATDQYAAALNNAILLLKRSRGM